MRSADHSLVLNVPMLGVSFEVHLEFLGQPLDPLPEGWFWRRSRIIFIRGGKEHVVWTVNSTRILAPSDLRESWRETEPNN
eukprot:784193-Amphidinium_carterae.1